MKALNAPTSSYRSDNRPVYSLPVIVDPVKSPMSPIVLSNPNSIAEYLDSEYPARPVFPEGSRAVQALFVHYIQEVFTKPLLPLLVPWSHQHLPHHVQPHFRGHHGPGPNYAIGRPSGPQQEQAWTAVREQ